MTQYAQQDRTRQAVILAGGLGTRLLPLTETKPKPMVNVLGRPFMEYLVEMLRDQGLTDIIMLLGYKADAIIDHFGDGGAWGVSIRYSVSEVENETGARLRIAEPLLGEEFLLLYCDNYWPLRFGDLWKRYKATDVDAQVVVYANKDGYSKNNMVIDENGIVRTYDKTRTQPGLSGVDLGFLLMKKSLINLLPEGNVSLEAELYPQLVEKGRLGAFVSDHHYYGVGSFKRLPQTQDFLERRPAILLDRDGVLNQKMPKGTYVRNWSEWTWMPGAKEALKRLTQANFRIFVVTNQAGVARDVMTTEDVQDVHRRMRYEAREAGGRIEQVYMCPHHWDEGCDCRKPKPGMLFQAQHEHYLDLTLTYFVGDDDRDRQAAEQAGCPFAQVDENNSLIDIVEKLV